MTGSLRDDDGSRVTEGPSVTVTVIVDTDFV